VNENEFMRQQVNNVSLSLFSFIHNFIFLWIDNCYGLVQACLMLLPYGFGCFECWFVLLLIVMSLQITVAANADGSDIAGFGGAY
jgi:hypothetical protein